MMNSVQLILTLAGCSLMAGCAASRPVSGGPVDNLVRQPDLVNAHVGILVVDPERSVDLYSYQSEKYFVPASNTKLFSLYAGMTYLGDSIAGIRYFQADTALFISPTGDPTFLHPDYARQPVIDLLKARKQPIYLLDSGWEDEALGAGWSWDDYNDDYMPERSALPVYGNLIRWVQERQTGSNANPEFNSPVSVYSIPEVDWKVRFTPDSASRRFRIKRSRDENFFAITEGNEANAYQDVPFITHGTASAIELLKDTLDQTLVPLAKLPRGARPLKILYSQRADSLYRPMMYRSDNFFAEQTLLMVSSQVLGFMNDRKIIDSLLHGGLSGLPQTPRWVDGSGLSRFNLFSPRDFVWLLNQMKNQFGMDRMERLLPTGGSGTLGNYYAKDSGYIYAKTGSLSGVIALSGYLISRQNHLLIFSILVNNHRGNTSAIRRGVEQFLEQVRKDH